MDVDFITRLKIEAAASGGKAFSSDKVRLRKDMIEGLGSFSDRILSGATEIRDGLYSVGPQDLFGTTEDQQKNASKAQGEVVLKSEVYGSVSPEEDYANKRVAHAENLFLNGKTAEAALYLDQTFKNKNLPDTAGALELRGMMHLGVWDTEDVKMLNPEAALSDLMAASDALGASSTFDIKKNIAFAHSLLGNPDVSADIYGELSRDVEASSADVNQLNFLKARCHLSMGDRDAAADHLSSAMRGTWSYCVHASIDPVFQGDADLVSEVIEARSQKLRGIAGDFISEMLVEHGKMVESLTASAEKYNRVKEVLEGFDVDNEIDAANPEYPYDFQCLSEKEFFSPLGQWHGDDNRHRIGLASIEKIRDDLVAVQGRIEGTGLLDMSDLIHEARKHVVSATHMARRAANAEDHRVSVKLVITPDVREYTAEDFEDVKTPIAARLSDFFMRTDKAASEREMLIEAKNDAIKEDVDRVLNVVEASFSKDVMGVVADCNNLLSDERNKAISIHRKMDEAQLEMRKKLILFPSGERFIDVVNNTHIMNVGMSISRSISVTDISNPFSGAPASSKDLEPFDPFLDRKPEDRGPEADRPGL